MERGWGAPRISPGVPESDGRWDNAGALNSGCPRAETDGSSRPRLRILFVLHRAPGGVRHTTQDLVSVLGDRCESFVLIADPHHLTLGRWDQASQMVAQIEDFWLRTPWTARRIRCEEHRLLYSRLLQRLNPDVLHVRHLLGHSVDLISEARILRIPIVLSFHDYYVACPSIHLLDSDGVFCGGVCTPSSGQCKLPVQWLHDLPLLKGGFLDQWREEMAGVVSAAEAIVITSKATGELMEDVYPGEVAERAVVVEHGRDFPKQHLLAGSPIPGGVVKIVTFGHLASHKGTAVIRELVELDRRRHDRLRFHLLGSGDRRTLGALGEWYGGYRREELPDLVARIRPAFAAILSSWAETYSHTLTEAWSLGLPVLVSRMGAQADRVFRRGGGWVVDIDDIEECYETILQIADDPKRYRTGLAAAHIEGLPSCEEMADAYIRIYETVSTTEM